MKINVLHARKRIALVEPSDTCEQFTADGKIARPKIAASFVGGSRVGKASLGSLSGNAPLKDAYLWIIEDRVLVSGNEVWVWNAVIVEKDEEIPNRMSSSAIPIGRRARAWALYDSHYTHVFC